MPKKKATKKASVAKPKAAPSNKWPRIVWAKGPTGKVHTLRIAPGVEGPFTTDDGHVSMDEGWAIQGDAT